MNVEQGFQLKDLRGMLRRRLPVVAGIAGAVLLAAIFSAAVLPNQFDAYTTLLVEPQVISKKLVEAGLEESNLNNRLHLMTMQILSRPRLSKIIDDLKLYPKESKKWTREEVIEYMRSHIRVEPVLPEMEREMNLLQRNREIEINTFRLFYRHEDADTAAAVANRLGNDFIEEHIKERVQISGDTSDFIESELARLQSKIADVEAKIAEVKGANPGKLPEDVEANQRILEQAIMNLRAAQRDMAQAQSDEAFYKQQALNAGVMPGAAADDANPRRRIEILEAQLRQLRARGLTDKHPDILAAQDEIKLLRERIDQKKDASDDDDHLTFPQQNAEAERRRAALRVEAAQADIDRISKQVDEVQARIADSPRVAEQLAALDREYKHLLDSFQQFSAKRLEAGVAANMERRQKGEQFRVLESAFPPPEPSSPNRPLILAVGAMLGLALGAGAGVLLESADSSFHATRQLQSALQVPVLIAVPEIVLEADRALIRRQRRRIAFASAAVTALVLVSSAGGYLWVNGAPGLFGRGSAAEEGTPSGGTPSATPPTTTTPALPSALPEPASSGASGGGN